MKSNIYAFTGAHSTGKTTSVYSMAANLKLISEGEVEIIRETARQCPFPVFGKESTPTEEAQAWIFFKQISVELETSARCYGVVSDRTCVDAIAYSRMFGFDDLADVQMAFARRHTSIYKQIIFKTIANNDYLKDDGFRSTDRPKREEMENILIGLYKELKLRVSFV